MVSEVNQVSHRADLKIQQQTQGRLTYGSFKLSIAEEKYKEMASEQSLTQAITPALIEAAIATIMAVTETEFPAESRRPGHTAQEQVSQHCDNQHVIGKCNISIIT